MSDPIRQRLARIAARPPAEWARRLDEEFPGDAQLQTQALLWLHSEENGVELEGVPPSLGEAADERYELTLKLDTGATATVWQAFDRRLGRTVAIKVFHDRHESEAVERVLAEARAASDVVSEHVVRVLDVQYGERQPYIVMELVSEYDSEKGEHVRGATAATTKPRSIDEVARWVLHVARGVHEAHLRNVFHRDLKPKNVLITPNSRRARVTDFGLAVSGAGPASAGGPLSVRGTPEYMAPEQARGIPLALDARSARDRAALVAIDVWGLGAIAYELLAGHPPWLPRKSDDLSAWETATSGERPSTLDRTADGDRIPRRLRRVVEKMMASDPDARYASAAAVADELQAFLARRATSLDRSRLVRIALWCRRNPQVATSVVVALALTGVALGTHATVTRLRSERNGLNRAVEEQRAEQARLQESVAQAHEDLERTRRKLATERQNLSSLEKALVEERSSYHTLIQAKEQALRDATTSARRIMEELEAARRERKATEEARDKVAQLAEDLRRDGEKAAKDRDRIRRERETARAERDAVERERDAAIAEREAVEKELRALQAELQRFKHTAM